MARFLSVFSGTAFPIDIVTSNSMSPVLMEGDLVAWTPATIDEVQVGDVIVFKSWVSWPDTKLVVHRVSNVLQNFKRPALETKGDANEWTDQAGPHIPEPYVTEKNFIGKVVSVGNIPLKVPFVGIIGIWINEGFKLLSQPSTAKGTVTNVGVFTPLIISVIILVISLFILPEKAKTIREKLRMYILGSQPLNMKSVFTFFLTIFIILLVIIHLFAYDSVTGSLGIGEFPDESGFSLGSVAPGHSTIPKPLPVFNPGIMPVKGVVFGTDNLHQFIRPETFQLGTGLSGKVNVSATAANGTVNGSYRGTMMVFSSPLWFIFPDGLMENVCAINGHLGIFILDVLSGLFFTVITIVTMALIAYFFNKYQIMNINLCWHFAPRNILKKGLGKRLRQREQLIKITIGRKAGWISQINLAELDKKPILLATAMVIPLLLLINSEILAMIIAALGAGLAAYFLQCPFRKKIVLASSLSMIFSVIFICLKTNYFLFTANRSYLEAMGLGCGAMGLYLLVLAFLLLPLSLLSWYCSGKLRNLKEQKDPLLILEGRCDL